MNTFKSRLFTLSCLLFFCCVVSASNVEAQNTSTPAPRGTDINHDVQLYLLIGSNSEGERSQLPTELRAVAKGLQASLPYTNYRVVATFLNRVKDGSSLEVSGVGNSLLPTTTTASQNTPLFYNFSLQPVKLVADSVVGEVVQVERLKFGMRVPTVVGTPGQGGGFPQVNYESVGLNTSVSMREATPVVIGTLASNRPDEVLVLVAQVKRAASR